MNEVDKLKEELKSWKSQEVVNRFENVGSSLHLIMVDELKLKIKRLKRGEDI